LLVVVRNHTTGSAWPLTNNPCAIYNDTALPDCNLKIPLWKVVRASTAAPVYFDPEEIVLDKRTHLFVDGGITPYNNPALIAGLTAVLPCYNMNWEPGPDKIRIISLGTMRFSSGLPDKVQKLWLGFNAAKIPAALMHGGLAAGLSVPMSRRMHLCRETRFRDWRSNWHAVAGKELVQLCPLQ
jgi:hypothetical protein